MTQLLRTQATCCKYFTKNEERIGITRNRCTIAGLCQEMLSIAHLSLPELDAIGCSERTPYWILIDRSSEIDCHSDLVNEYSFLHLYFLSVGRDKFRTNRLILAQP